MRFSRNYSIETRISTARRKCLAFSHKYVMGNYAALIMRLHLKFLVFAVVKVAVIHTEVAADRDQRVCSAVFSSFLSIGFRRYWASSKFGSASLCSIV
jgi:hypothetical protein